MIPAVSKDLQSNFVYAEHPVRTFKLNMNAGTIAGFTDGLDAVRQAVYLILNTERYENLIYSWNYGIELKSLFGQPVSYVLPELKRRITEALMQDTRITGVDEFDLETAKSQVHASFTVHTIYGDMQAEKVVVI